MTAAVFLFLFSVVSVSSSSADGKAIKIGIVGPMKFPAGEHMWYGAELAAEEINERGGILLKGQLHKVELVKADSNEYLSVTDAVSALERVISFNKVKYVIGGARSEAILAQQELMADNKIIYIMSGGGSPTLNGPVTKDYDRYKYFFRTTTPNTWNQLMVVNAALEMCATKIREEIGIETPKVALLMEKAVWADGMVKLAEATLPKVGMEIVGVWRPSVTANDLTAELSAIKSAGAQIIYTGFTGPVGVIFGKQIGELQIPAAPMGVNIEAMMKKYWETTGGQCEYEMLLNPVVNAAITQKTIPFFEKYVARHKDYPLYTGPGGYDGVYLLKDAIERSQSLDTEVLVAALEQTDFLGVAGRMQFTQKGSKLVHDLKFGPRFSTLFAQQWIDGDLVTVWPNGQMPNAALGFESGWEGLKFSGTMPYELPPQVKKYWTGKQ